ncbi:SWIB-domain-containing protein [Sporormia fimetaria CBS 119925]|uniref:SWIB-domain-containing protein n=1 Tax=Sporormia fimetaria CBS 119925 TaxID=1340428 RepID=A0A6A6VJB7_9PLEO|nr:SWIB-domain-containing protein [Sporormia fimetaria CBS 119925]
MSTTLTSEERVTYAKFIDGILAVSDIESVSAKRIRKGLQEMVGRDLTAQKEAVNNLIHERFDRYTAHNGCAEPEAVVKQENGTTGSSNGTPEEGKTPVSKKRSPDEDTGVSSVDDSPPKKKVKKQKTAEDDDAAYAAKLQAELNASTRTRSTRGGNAKKKRPTVTKKTKKKTSARVKEEDDSDVASGSGAEKKKVKRTGGFHRPLVLSPALQALIGETQLSRPQIVKKIWEYIREKDLQDPNDKRQIFCDDAMRAVFKQDKVHMFTMNKMLSQQVYAVDEV